MIISPQLFQKYAVSSLTQPLAATISLWEEAEAGVPSAGGQVDPGERGTHKLASLKSAQEGW